MSVREFELFHGIALTKIMRSDRPVTLRMIETNPDEAWAAYRINDEIVLYIKYRTVSRELRRNGGGLAWSFMFGTSELVRCATCKPTRCGATSE
jgi:hypothetical protein